MSPLYADQEVVLADRQDFTPALATCEHLLKYSEDLIIYAKEAEHGKFWERHSLLRCQEQTCPLDIGEHANSHRSQPQSCSVIHKGGIAERTDCLRVGDDDPLPAEDVRSNS